MQKGIIGTALGAVGGFLNTSLSNSALNESIDKQLGIIGEQKGSTVRLQALKKTQRMQSAREGQANNVTARSGSGIDLESDVYKQLDNQYAKDFALNEQLENEADRLQLLGLDATSAGISSQRPGGASFASGISSGIQTGLSFSDRF